MNLHIRNRPFTSKQSFAIELRGIMNFEIQLYSFFESKNDS